MKKSIKQVNETTFYSSSTYTRNQTTKVRKMIMPERKNKSGECIVYIEILKIEINDKQQKLKKYKRIPTEVTVLPNNWSKTKEEVLRKDKEYIYKNTSINEVYNKISKYVNDLENQTYRQEIEQEFTILSNFFPSNETKVKGVVDYFNDFMKFKKSSKEVTDSTLTTFQQTLNVLEKYEKSIGKKLLFENINLSFSDNFKYFLSNDDELELENSTIKKHLDRLVTFLNFYYERKNELWINLDDKFRSRNFKKITVIQQEPNPLSNDEFQKVIESDNLTDEQQRVKDAIILQCSTGLRHSDLFNIKPSNIINDVIRILPHKTKRHNIIIEIPLNEHSKEILKKYGNDSSKILPKNGYNDKIKLFLKHIKIKDDRANSITSHNFRDTFISFCIKKGIDIPTVMSYTGHTNYDSIKKYIKLDTQHKIDQMKKLF